MQPDSGTFEGQPPGRLLLIVTFLAVIATLVGLRILQLLSHAPALCNPEFLYNGRLMLEAHAADGILQYIRTQPLSSLVYLPTQQGTLAIQLAAAALSIVTGPNVWALHATTILAEVLAVALLVALLLRFLGPCAAVLGTLPWLFPPGPVVMWQLLPFGNHTEFMAIPLAIALFYSDPELPRRRWQVWIFPALLLGLGIMLYRPTIASVAALWVASALRGSRRIFGLATACSVVAVVVAVLCLLGLHGTAPFAAEAGSLESILPAIDPGATGIFRNAAAIWPNMPFAPTVGGIRLPFFLVVGLGLVVAGITIAHPRTRLGGHAPVLTFATLWALASLGLCLQDGWPKPPHYIQLLYAVFVAIALLQIRGLPQRLRTCASVTLVLLGLAGLPDAVTLLEPSVWVRNTSYDGLALAHETGLSSFDSDDFPHVQRMIDEGRAEHLDGDLSGIFDTQFLMCDADALERWRTGRPPSAVEGRCNCWSRGALGRMVESTWTRNPDVDLPTVGRMAWILCNRDLEGVERSIDGLDVVHVDEILRGAREEAVAQTTPPLGR